MRPRNRLNRNLPPNLYISKKGSKYYYRYRHPVSGKETGMGSDKHAAIRAAHELNGRLTPAAPDLVARVIGGTHRLGGWLNEYLEIFESRGLSHESIKARRSQVKRIRAAFGKCELSTLQHDVKACAEFLKAIEDEGKMRTAQQVRTALIDVFNEARRSGLVTENPAAVTRNARSTVTRSRLTLSDFQAILVKAEAMAPWVANAMLLALLTGQRRMDIAAMRFKDIQDEWLHVEQHKTGAKVRLSLGLRLDAMGMTVGEAVSRCRDRVVSPYLVHHVKNSTNAKAGGRLSPNSLSRGFADARNLADLSWDGSPPSFHEIRSLSARLYDKQATDTQALLGHSDPATTRKYTDSRGAEWIEVGA